MLARLSRCLPGVLPLPPPKPIKNLTVFQHFPIKKVWKTYGILSSGSLGCSPLLSINTSAGTRTHAGKAKRAAQADARVENPSAKQPPAAAIPASELPTGWNPLGAAGMLSSLQKYLRRGANHCGKPQKGCAVDAPGLGPLGCRSGCKKKNVKKKWSNSGMTYSEHPGSNSQGISGIRNYDVQEF